MKSRQDPSYLWNKILKLLGTEQKKIKTPLPWGRGRKPPWVETTEGSNGRGRAGLLRMPYFWDPGTQGLTKTVAGPGQQRIPPTKPASNRNKQQKPVAGGSTRTRKQTPSEEQASGWAESWGWSKDIEENPPTPGPLPKCQVMLHWAHLLIRPTMYLSFCYPKHNVWHSIKNSTKKILRHSKRQGKINLIVKRQSNEQNQIQMTDAGTIRWRTENNYE